MSETLPSNSRSVIEDKVIHAAVEYAAYERLPREIRFAISECNLQVSAVGVELELYRCGCNVKMILIGLANWELNEAQRWAVACGSEFSGSFVRYNSRRRVRRWYR